VLFKVKRLAVIGLILAGNIYNLIAQEVNKQIIIGDSISLNSEILNEKRDLLIYCPSDYDQKDKKYPVLYLLDAEYQLHYTTGVIAFLSDIGHIPEMIVVGITNTDRDRDLTPEPGEAQRRRFPTSGGAELFLKFLHQELIPYIESHYRVQPFKILVGWSLGGLFSIHAMLSHPEIFDAYIAMSPSLYWNDQIEISKAEKLLNELTSFNKSLFMTIGNERDEMVKSSKGFSEVLEKYALPDFSWEYEPMFEETHSSIKLKSIYKGLEFIFSDLRLVEKINDAGFNDYYKKLTGKYGYSIKLSQDFLYRAYNYFWENEKFEDAVDAIEYFANEHSESFSNLSPRFVQAGNELMDRDMYECAIKLYELITRTNDKIFGAYKGLGDAYNAVEKKEAALENYERALKLRPNDQYIKEQINKLTKKNPTQYCLIGSIKILDCCSLIIDYFLAGFSRVCEAQRAFHQLS
jgi:predicted alpha/beta superfamily hydrolase